MMVIGITGGVGAGKSELLNYLKTHYPCRILMADRMAEQLREPGQSCYEPLIDLLGREVLQENGQIDKQKMAEMIFHDASLLQKVNAIIHPAVTREIQTQIAEAGKNPEIRFFFVEAALLIENGFDKICDELWYIYASEQCRRERLARSRGYSQEKIEAIMQKQLGDAVFRKYCSVVIDNSNTPEESFRQIDHTLEGYPWHS